MKRLREKKMEKKEGGGNGVGGKRRREEEDGRGGKVLQIRVLTMGEGRKKVDSLRAHTLQRKKY